VQNVQVEKYQSKELKSTLLILKRERKTLKQLLENKVREGKQRSM
jgi:hypothetical protein